MARKPVFPKLLVTINNQMVGHLGKTASGQLWFLYLRKWLNLPYALPVSHSIPLREDGYKGEVVERLIDNLLPDGEFLRRSLARNSDVSGVDAFSLLREIGRECGGALGFHDQNKEDAILDLDSQSMSKVQLANAIKHLHRLPLGIASTNQLRYTLSGSQSKICLRRHENKWFIPGAGELTTHIFKPAIGKLGDQDLSTSVENEFLCLQILQALDLPVVNNTMEAMMDQQVLCVERFDRLHTADGRLIGVPSEDCSQALGIPIGSKYESEGGAGIVSILNLLKGSDNPARDQHIFISAQIAYWLMGATDGHAKNFSLYLNPGGGFSLAPLYDVMSAQPLLDRGQLGREEMTMSMSAGKNKVTRVDEILPQHYIESTTLARVSKQLVVEAMNNIRSKMPLAIKQVVDRLPSRFPDRLRFSIMNGIQQRMRLLNNLSF